MGDDTKPPPGNFYTIEEYEVMSILLKNNSRSYYNYSDRQHNASRVHLFFGIAYCGKCGNKMVSTSGRLHVDGYRPSNYSCPKRRNTKEYDNQTMNDNLIGEFVVNYILNMLNAKKNFLE